MWRFEPNCQMCHPYFCAGDCEYEATGSTKCVLKKISNTSTVSNRLPDMSQVSTSISNSTPPSNQTMEPLNIQSMESRKTTEGFPTSSQIQSNPDPTMPHYTMR